MICFNFVLRMVPPTEPSSLESSASRTGVSRQFGGKFSSEQTAASLDAGHRHSSKGLLFKTDKVPAHLLLREMEISQLAVVESTMESKLLSPEVQACVFYLLLPRNPSKHCILGTGRQHFPPQHRRKEKAFETGVGFN